MYSLLPCTHIFGYYHYIYYPLHTIHIINRWQYKIIRQQCDARGRDLTISSPHPVRYQPTGIIRPNTFNNHKMPRRTHSQTQPASSSTNPSALDSEAPKRPGKEKATEPNVIDAVQMNNHQTQLKESIGMMSQEIGTIKELLERLFVPQAPRGNDAVEKQRTE